MRTALTVLMLAHTEDQKHQRQCGKNYDVSVDKNDDKTNEDDDDDGDDDDDNDDNNKIKAKLTKDASRSRF